MCVKDEQTTVHYFAKSKVREAFEDELVPLATPPQELGLVDPGGGEGWDAHAVTQEQDHVPGHARVLLHVQRIFQLLQGLLVPISLIWRRGNKTVVQA